MVAIGRYHPPRGPEGFFNRDWPGDTRIIMFGQKGVLRLIQALIWRLIAKARAAASDLQRCKFGPHRKRGMGSRKGIVAFWPPAMGTIILLQEGARATTRSGFRLTPEGGGGGAPADRSLKWEKVAQELLADPWGIFFSTFVCCRWGARICSGWEAPPSEGKKSCTRYFFPSLPPKTSPNVRA